MTELEERPFPGTGDPSLLLPDRGEDGAPFADGLRARRLMLQRCEGCGSVRYPPGPVCPYCLGADHAWAELGGRGTIHSWVRYHRSYLPAFESLLPYVVLCVELAEGPRVFGRLCDGDRGGRTEPSTGMEVRAIVERCAGGGCILAFTAGRGS